MELRVNLGNNSGFTLIEFCVSVVILMVGMLGLLQAVNMAYVHNRETGLRNEAVIIADSKMVDVKNSVINATTFAALASGTDAAVKPAFKNYSFSVNRMVTTQSANSKEVLITVAWWYAAKRVRHNISTLVINPEP